MKLIQALVASIALLFTAFSANALPVTRTADAPSIVMTTQAKPAATTTKKKAAKKTTKKAGKKTKKPKAKKTKAKAAPAKKG